MAYVPGCRYDLFVSYASDEQSDAWLAKFVEKLGKELHGRLGREFLDPGSIFFFRKDIQVGDSVARNPNSAARDSAVLVPVLSPSYVSSQPCIDEKAAFLSKFPYADEQIECLTPIVFRPIDFDSQLGNLFRAAYRLSFLDVSTNTPLLADSDRWNEKLLELAKQIEVLLRKLRQKCKPVFLGKAVTKSSQQLRDSLREELKKKYYRIEPESLLELDDTAAINARLSEVELSIHFLVSADHKALEAIEASITFPRCRTIAYQPTNSRLTSDEEYLLKKLETQDLPLERYQHVKANKDSLLGMVNNPLSSNPGILDLKIAKTSLALVCEEKDLEQAQGFTRKIRDLRPSAQIQTPDFLEQQLTAMERLRQWHHYLSHGQAFLFYYGATDHSQLEVLRRIAKQYEAQLDHAWFLAPPNLNQKRRRYPNALQNENQVLTFLDASLRRRR